MDANSISEHSIEKFVRKIFNSDRNFVSLTKADLRNKYIKEKGITEFSVEEKKLFSSVVNEVFDEFTKSIKTSNKCLLDEASYDSKKKSGKSKSATPKWKIVNSDDEGDSGMFDSGHNKENVESVEIDKNTSAKDGDFSDADVSKSCDSGSPLVLESQIKLDDRKQVDNAKLKELPNNGIESHHVESSSEAGSSDGDFVMKKNSKKAKTQQLNFSVSDSDDNSNAEGNNSDQDGAAPARKQKKTRQEIKQKTNKKRKVSESDSESSDQSLTSNEKKKSKLETSRKRKAQKPLNPKHQNESDVSSGSESESELQEEEEEEKNNRKNKQSKLDKAPKNSKNKRKISESDGESSDQVSMSNENKKSKTKNKFKTSKKRKIQKPFDLKDQNGSDMSSGNESESEFREEKTNGKNRKSKPSEASKKSKNSPPSNSRIEHLKKYLRTAGLRVQSYNKLFESCRSQKAKVEKLLEVLQKAGLKGTPTLEKCKKLKKKIEEKKDVESLDLTNIIETKGRPRRNTSKLHPSPSLMETTEAPPANHFSNLKGIVDSDDNDAPMKTSSRKRTVINDDDDSS